MNMYPERVEDAWGYRSENENFDYRYGMARSGGFIIRKQKNEQKRLGW